MMQGTPFCFKDLTNVIFLNSNKRTYIVHYSGRAYPTVQRWINGEYKPTDNDLRNLALFAEKKPTCENSLQKIRESFRNLIQNAPLSQERKDILLELEKRGTSLNEFFMGVLKLAVEQDFDFEDVQKNIRPDVTLVKASKDEEKQGSRQEIIATNNSCIGNSTQDSNDTLNSTEQRISADGGSVICGVNQTVTGMQSMSDMFAKFDQLVRAENGSMIYNVAQTCNSEEPVSNTPNNQGVHDRASSKQTVQATNGSKIIGVWQKK